jgi:hypothetical protein
MIGGARKDDGEVRFSRILDELHANRYRWSNREPSFAGSMEIEAPAAKEVSCPFDP